MMKRIFILCWVFSLALPPLSAQVLSPEQAVQRMKPADGLQVQVVAAEPVIRQPVTMTFDSRGRLWVIQYLQYPTPAGLTAVEVDQYLRTKYDRVPEPPPRGPRGKDRVTILYDQDDMGRYRQSKDFTGGLNLATGLALGHGGVYVLQAPYLLFYPDRNRDDVPDSEPEVLLSGFGMEDAHAVGNSLVWGPDGWLYGAQGSTVTAKIADPLTKKQYEFQQGVWRYHPRTKQFELFAEGGGNTWGLDFDSTGQVIAGTNWGGMAALHMVQGGYYVKGFAKHGPLHHAHSYGYFEHLPCKGFRGGHVTCGGIVYQGTLLPSLYRNNYLACNVLDNNLYQYSLNRSGSSFTMQHEGTLLQGNDQRFRPIDLLTGPEGAVYVCDWHDKRANHVDPVDNWEKASGRIYRLTPVGYQQRSQTFDLDQLTTEQLITMLKHANSWQRGEARRILGERHDARAQAALRLAVDREYDALSLDLLWACYCAGGLDSILSNRLIQHPDENIRAWVIRYASDHLADAKKRQSIIEHFPALARKEKSAIVRSQLACTVRRLLGVSELRTVCLSTLMELWRHDENAADKHIPLLLWWALEESVSQSQGSITMEELGFHHRDGLRGAIVRQTILERLSRRLMSMGSPAGYRTASKLLDVCFQQHEDGPLLKSIYQGMEKALEGTRLKAMPDELSGMLFKCRAEDRSNTLLLLKLLVRCGDAQAYQIGLKLIQSTAFTEVDRGRVLEALTQGTPAPSAEILLTLLKQAQTDQYRLVILEALGAQIDSKVSAELLKLYSASSAQVKRRMLDHLIARRDTLPVIAMAIESGLIVPKDVSLEQVQRLVRFGDPKLGKLISKHWGNITPQSPGEKQARIRSVVHMLGQGKGNAELGKAHYTQHCGTCHVLFGEGGKVGPELTGADRNNREFLATHIVDPSFIIRPEYAAHTVVTTDGRTLSGLLVEQDANVLVLLDAQANKITLPRNRIEDTQPSRHSLMPEKLMDTLDEQQIRDLFAYLQKPVSASQADAPFKSDLITAPPKFDFAEKMVQGIDHFLDEEIKASVQRREALWKRDTTSPEAYAKSMEPYRERLQTILGMVDPRPATPQLEYVSSPTRSAVIAEGSKFTVSRVRWRAFGNVDVEGLLLEPIGEIKASVVAIPDADQTPEQISGIGAVVPAEMQFARRLAQQGCRVLVPTLINRSDTYSGVPGIRMTNQPHREWIYRQSFEMGRHILGYEVQKVLAGVDWLSATNKGKHTIGIIGYAEGGLVAMLAGALDPRVSVTCVDGYFGGRDEVWHEPIYRNVWRQLALFGDAEIAGMCTPRKLVINRAQPPMVTGPPAARAGRAGAAPGRIGPVHPEQEWKRLEPIRKLFPLSFHLNPYKAGNEIDIAEFVKQLYGGALQSAETSVLKSINPPADPELRMQQQIAQLAEHTQSLYRQSQAYRDKHFWSQLDTSSLAKYLASTERHRQRLEAEVIGMIDRPFSPARARSRKLYEQPGYIAYEVELDVFAPDVIAYGWFLVPRDMKPGERRPVVVCQHGLEGRPADLADPKIDSPYYHQYACKLAERGFVVFAPQNPYLFGDRFRMLQRKANPLGLSLFSFIVAQHRQITDWLAGLPFVDPERIGFYGLSYGGKTAMRVPALVPRYCLSICSADFNEWIWKNVTIDNRYTYMTTNEWEMVEWNLGHTFNYAEMAALIAPRPFMVERGHRDGVAPDEQVAYEYAKVRRLYADLKIPERTAIEFFDGPHMIHGVGTFQFLHQHLKWPMR